MTSVTCSFSRLFPLSRQSQPPPLNFPSSSPPRLGSFLASSSKDERSDPFFVCLRSLSFGTTSQTDNRSGPCAAVYKDLVILFFSFRCSAICQSCLFTTLLEDELSTWRSAPRNARPCWTCVISFLVVWVGFFSDLLPMESFLPSVRPSLWNWPCLPAFLRLFLAMFEAFEPLL